jgi:hypothetical protein
VAVHRLSNNVCLGAQSLNPCTGKVEVTNGNIIISSLIKLHFCKKMYQSVSKILNSEE